MKHRNPLQRKDVARIVERSASKETSVEQLHWRRADCEKEKKGERKPIWGDLMDQQAIKTDFHRKRK